MSGTVKLDFSPVDLQVANSSAYFVTPWASHLRFSAFIIRFKFSSVMGIESIPYIFAPPYMKVEHECNKGGAGIRYGAAERLLEIVDDEVHLTVLRNGQDVLEELHQGEI